MGRTKESTDRTIGFAYGFLGMLVFSLTLPATRVGVTYMDPLLFALGRAVMAGVLAALILWATRQPLPHRSHWKSLVLTGLGVIIGFPFLTAWALRRLPSAHGAIVLGLLPLATAGFAALRAGERPSRPFWLASLAGSGAVVAFAFSAGAGRLQAEDLALLGAVLAAAFGYAEGGKLAQVIGGWQVICWSLVPTAPLLVVPHFLMAGQKGLTAPPAAWLAFAYVTLFSQLLGFFAWYAGLARGGVARVGQLQLLQPFLTLLFSALLLGEKITPAAAAAALVVLAAVAFGQKAAVQLTLPALPRDLGQGR